MQSSRKTSRTRKAKKNNRANCMIMSSLHLLNCQDRAILSRLNQRFSSRSRRGKGPSFVPPNSCDAICGVFLVVVVLEHRHTDKCVYRHTDRQAQTPTYPHTDTHRGASQVVDHDQPHPHPHLHLHLHRRPRRRGSHATSCTVTTYRCSPNNFAGK